MGTRAGTSGSWAWNEAGDLSLPELLTRANEFERIDDLARVHALRGYWMDMYKLIPTWSAMSRIVLRLQGHAGWRDREVIRDYQANRLGRLKGDTFLTEILPLPAPSTNSWPYGALFDSRATYAERVLRGRLRYLANLFQQHQPRYVFGYGKAYWPYYREIVGTTVLEELEPGKSAVGVRGQSCVVLTHFFSRYFMTDDRVEAMAQRIASS